MKSLRRRLLIAALGATLLSGAAAARTWTVGPGGDAETMVAALKLAGNGDTILLLPGEHRGLVATIRHQALTIRGAEPGRPVIRADGRNAQGKAIWVVNGGRVRIENIEFRDARAADNNGAGIRLEGGELELLRCAFIDNEAGLMSANKPDIRLSIDDSHFENAVRTGQGLSHLIYVGRIAEFRMRGSRLHQAHAGHLLKSRAQRNWLAYNLIADGPKGSASYEIELPNGGDATLIGNIVVQGKASENNAVIAYGAEGNRWPRNRLRLSHNTLVNERRLPARFLKLWPDRVRNAEVIALNNLTVGPGLFDLGIDGRFEGNLSRWQQVLVDPTLFDFALDTKAWAIGKSIELLKEDSELRPTAEFRLPIGTRPLSASLDSWVPGAIQR